MCGRVAREPDRQSRLYHKLQRIVRAEDDEGDVWVLCNGLGLFPDEILKWKIDGRYEIKEKLISTTIFFSWSVVIFVCLRLRVSWWGLSL